MAGGAAAKISSLFAWSVRASKYTASLHSWTVTIVTQDARHDQAGNAAWLRLGVEVLELDHPIRLSSCVSTSR